MDDANNNEYQPDACELRAVAAALEGELERLKESLETHRLLDYRSNRTLYGGLFRTLMSGGSSVCLN